MAVIQGPISIVNDQYDPDPAAGEFANEQYHQAADGMLWDGSAWRKVTGAILWDGSAWRELNSGITGSATPRGISQAASTCSGSVPTYRIDALLNGSAGARLWIYWYRNGVNTFNQRVDAVDGDFTSRYPGSGANAPQDYDVISYALDGAGTWPNSSPANPPSAPFGGPTYNITCYLACGRQQ